MSLLIDTVVGPKSTDDIEVTAYNGGEKGQMIQLVVANENQGFDVIKLTEGQVRHLNGILNVWLDN